MGQACSIEHQSKYAPVTNGRATTVELPQLHRRKKSTGLIVPSPPPLGAIARESLDLLRRAHGPLDPSAPAFARPVTRRLAEPDTRRDRGVCLRPLDGYARVSVGGMDGPIDRCASKHIVGSRRAFVGVSGQVRCRGYGYSADRRRGLPRHPRSTLTSSAYGCVGVAIVRRRLRGSSSCTPVWS